MKRKRLNNKGFSMVELLAVVTILGILSVLSIVSVRGLLKRARVNYYKTQQENMIIAATSYFDNNSSLKPKASGEYAEVTLETLNKGKYIDKVIDYNKDECSIDKSKVRIFKYENSYYYTANLDCPDDQSSNIYTASTKTNIDFKFDTGLDTAKVDVSITNEALNGSTDAGIVSYQYKIYKDGKLVYTSETFNAKKATSIKKTISLKKYIPSDSIKVKVSATDIYGNVTTKSSSQSYKDETPPACNNPTPGNKTWTRENVTVSYECHDVGLGCARATYEKTYKDQEIKTDNITLKDKAGNKSSCSVNVYLDKMTPKVTVKAYKSNEAHNGKADNTVVGQVTVNPKNAASAEGELKTYSNLVAGWLNKANYPYGLYFEVTYSDFSGVKTATWSWNNSDIKTDDYKNLNGGSNEKASDQSEKSEHTFGFSLSAEGKRYGDLVIKDNAGNKTTIHITAFMDRTKPTTPTVSMYKWNSNSEPTSTSGLEGYTNNTWSSKKVYTVASSTDSMSGIDYYKYTAGSSTGKKNTYSVTSDGVTKLVYIACDKAGNCSDNSSEKTIKVDTTAPTLTIRAYKRTSSGDKTGNVIKEATTTTSGTVNFDSWLNIGTYPYGIYYEVIATDGQGLTNWKWNYNPGGLAPNASNINDFSAGASYDINTKSLNEHVQISQSGWRKGVITITDVAGNTCKISVQAPFDDQAPSAPSGTPGYKNGYDPAVYASAWGSGDSLSGISQYLYCIKTDGSTPGNNDGCFTSNTYYSRDCGVTHYVWAIAVDGSNNRSGVSYLGAVGDNGYSWNWTDCSATCDGGTRTGYNTCELVGPTSEVCNTSPCVHTFTDFCGSTVVNLSSFWGGGFTCHSHSSKHNGRFHSTGRIHYVRDDATGQLYVRSENVRSYSPIAGQVLSDGSINTYSFCCPEYPAEPLIAD